MTAAPPPTPPGLDTGKVFSSARWLVLGQAVTQVTRLAVSVVLARLLAPEEFGLLSMAAVFTVLAGLFATLGTGPVIVQRPVLSEALLRSLTTLGIAMGFALTGLLSAAAWSIARFYGDPRVVWITIALGTSFAIESFGLVPDGLLQRELRFGQLVLVDTVQLVLSSALSVYLAVIGWGVWALIAGNVVGIALRTGLLVAMSPWRIRLGFSREEARGVLGFSAGVMGFNVVHYLARYSDRLLIGRTLGATNLGYYDYAYRFYTYPLDVVTSVLMRLMFPTFARLQQNPAQLGRAFVRTNRAIAFITFPMMAGLGVTADPFVRVVLGEKWAPIIPLIQILAPLAMLQSMGATPGQLFLACGKAALRFWWSVIYTSVIVVGVLIGSHWGILGVAAAYATVMVPIILGAFSIAFHLVGLKLTALWDALRSTIAATAIMCGIVFAARVALHAIAAPKSVELAVGAVVGAITYVWVVRWLAPEAMVDLHRILPASTRARPVVAWLFRTVELST